MINNIDAAIQCCDYKSSVLRSEARLLNSHYGVERRRKAYCLQRAKEYDQQARQLILLKLRQKETNND